MIAVNGTFPGPLLNVTTNNNVVINVRNRLDEVLLITWLVTKKIEKKIRFFTEQMNRFDHTAFFFLIEVLFVIYVIGMGSSREELHGKMESWAPTVPSRLVGTTLIGSR